MYECSLLVSSLPLLLVIVIVVVGVVLAVGARGGGHRLGKAGPGLRNDDGSGSLGADYLLDGLGGGPVGDDLWAAGQGGARPVGQHLQAAGPGFLGGGLLDGPAGSGRAGSARTERALDGFLFPDVLEDGLECWRSGAPLDLLLLNAVDRP